MHLLILCDVAVHRFIRENKYMHHLAYLEMIIPRERERREKTEREKNLSYKDVEWEKLVHGDLLKKQRV